MSGKYTRTSPVMSHDGRQQSAKQGKVAPMKIQSPSGSLLHMKDRRIGMLAVLTTSLLLTSCSTAPPLLNSERIESRFGNYFVRVMYQDEQWRMSSLESTDDSGPVTRTMAVVRYADDLPDALLEPHRTIVAGGSIGATFRNAGWAIRKSGTYIGPFDLAAHDTTVGALMKLPEPKDIALHTYDFVVSRDGQDYRYASIVELHHPDYLSAHELQTIYGPSTFSTEVATLLSALQATLRHKAPYLVR
ncbi:hypothetical protein [Woeseia oceani]|uniref:Uncharacterized protein n=1 Tax=Woeseia oceani TaxID=1548547 RepID=A0A193LFH9_9GAMM|nr:hypothetical protein [Woeseia oceani]ANO51262.1 hypothetical protein BA177_08655 [Woeseia oceani]